MHFEVSARSARSGLPRDGSQAKTYYFSHANWELAAGYIFITPISGL